jgi:hypothetical protein
MTIKFLPFLLKNVNIMEELYRNEGILQKISIKYNDIEEICAADLADM